MSSPSARYLLNAVHNLLDGRDALQKQMERGERDALFERALVNLLDVIDDTEDAASDLFWEVADEIEPNSPNS